MPDAYTQLLDVTIQHLESLQARGVRFVDISSDQLAQLKSSAAGSGRPAPAPPKPAPAPVRPAAFAAPRPAPSPRPAVSQPEILAGAPGSVAAAAAPKLSPEEKVAAIQQLRERVLPCVKCKHLAEARKNVVFGVGSPNAELMFVGEAPGADEDEQGEPFVGKAGQLLTKIIQTMGLSRETVYIANILKCRPDTPGQSAGNRKPTPEEMQTCLPYLQEQIDIIQPKVIVALGATAVEGLLGKTEGITRLRGNWRSYRGTPLMPTYHPAYLLRNQAMSEKRRVWEDMLQVMETLGLPISEKQRGYFLKPAGS
jgi:DNA polymerase